MAYAGLPRESIGALMGWHKALSVTTCLYGFWRVGWRIFKGFPPHPVGTPAWQAAASKTVHVSLLTAILAMPVSGIPMTIACGRWLDIWGVTLLPTLGEIVWLESAAETLHEQAPLVIVALLAAHIGAALKHHFIDHDAPHDIGPDRLPIGRVTRPYKIREKEFPMPNSITFTGCAILASLAFLNPAVAQPTNPPPSESVALELAQTPRIAPADAKAQVIVDAARTFLDTLDAEQRDAMIYPFDDNDQRALWSNLPVSFVERGGLARQDLDDDQLAALDSLLAEVLSADGLRNARLQRFADGKLTNGGTVGNGDVLEFGEELYYVSFLGEPATDAPWMLQYGGHHLAINATFAGGQASFSPMLTGGQPLTVEYDGESVYITAAEVDAARAFMDSLDDAQQPSAIVSDRAIQLLLGPGAHGTTIAPEGIGASDLDDAQKEALLAVIEARIGQLNERDADAVMANVRDGLDETTFGWWGPQEPYGAAYFRIVGPKIMLEYSPQEQGGNAVEHTHNMYRDPTNDYGRAWIGARQ